MAGSKARAYFDSFSPEDQAAIRDSWGGADLMDEWYRNAEDAGAVPVEGGAAPGGGGWRPRNKAELVEYAAKNGWSEDFARFDPGTVQHWIDNYWDPNAGAFRTAKTDPQGNPIEGFVEKPDDVPEGWEAWGQVARQKGGGGGGGGGFGGPGGGGGGFGVPGGGAYGGATTGFGGAPAFDAPDFVPPSYEEAMADPGYQFALREGADALQKSAAAKGLLRTSGTLKDLIRYGQDAATQQYGNVFDRAMKKYGADFGAAQAEFDPRYGSWQTAFGAGEDRWRTQYGGDLSKWQTQYGGDLQKYLQREGNIYGLLSAPPPVYGG